VTAPDTTQQHAVEWLRQAIVAGVLKPGERIPQEEIAERIGVSLIPVREALRVLEGEGQVTYRPRRGYAVTVLRIEDLTEIYELRRMLEGQAVRRALPDVDDAAIARMTHWANECSEAAAAGHISRELDANRQLHFALFEHPSQPHALRLIRLLWDSTEAYRALYYTLPSERAAADAAHRRILAAVRARDADALVAELDAHRQRALEAVSDILRAADAA
jgi:DNA-binding GntR family transcriptional regulator